MSQHFAYSVNTRNDVYNFDSINRLAKQTKRIHVSVKVLVIVQYLEPDRHNHDEVQFSTAIRRQILTFPVVENLFCGI